MSETACCPSDEDLMPILAGESLSTQVTSHLNGCSVCRRRLEQLRADLEELRSVSPPEATLSTREMPPSRPPRIGKYLVVGTLDSGGQSRVFRALHPMLDKELAIKLSRRPVDGQAEERHFLVAEGKLLAGLDHPNLARIYDLDFHEDYPFLAMEYVRGSDLKRFTGGAPLPPRQAARVVAEVARALAVVHRHGIVHQDLKPQNILIDPQGHPRLIDFGLARLRHAWDDSPEEPTGGTPAFMAPEQARGETTSVGPRSDLFALGGVLYFLLTGQAPFAAGDVAGALDRARRCDFDRTALRRARAPRRLETICLKAMAAEPTDRYPSAEEMAGELERYLRRPQVLARIGLATAAVLLLALGIWALRQPPPPPSAPPTAPRSEVAEMRVQVERNGQYLDLVDALPLAAGTDNLQVVAKLPAGRHAVMLNIDPRGKVKPLSFQESSASSFNRLVYPGGGKLVRLEPDAPGTELVLVCASSAASPEGLEDLVRSTLLPPLPPLPPKVLVWLNGDEPHRQARPFGAEETNPVAQVEARLDHLRQRLCDRGIETILGVAFAH